MMYEKCYRKYSLNSLYEIASFKMSNDQSKTRTLRNSRSRYSTKFALPFVYNYLHQNGLKVFHNKIVKPGFIDEIQMDDLLNESKVKIRYLNKPMIIRNVSHVLQSKSTELWTTDYFYKYYGDQNVGIINKTCTMEKWPWFFWACSGVKGTFAKFIDETQHNNQHL